MPRISAFYGVTIRMYWDEGALARPHFHARYDEYEARLPRRADRRLALIHDARSLLSSSSEAAASQADRPACG
jgi:hypothetical protein